MSLLLPMSRADQKDDLTALLRQLITHACPNTGAQNSVLAHWMSFAPNQLSKQKSQFSKRDLKDNKGSSQHGDNVQGFNPLAKEFVPGTPLVVYACKPALIRMRCLLHDASNLLLEATKSLRAKSPKATVAGRTMHLLGAV